LPGFYNSILLAREYQTKTQMLLFFFKVNTSLYQYHIPKLQWFIVEPNIVCSCNIIILQLKVFWVVMSNSISEDLAGFILRVKCVVPQSGHRCRSKDQDRQRYARVNRKVGEVMGEERSVRHSQSKSVVGGPEKECLWGSQIKRE
jgi:hypothetical protein